MNKAYRKSIKSNIQQNRSKISNTCATERLQQIQESWIFEQVNDFQQGSNFYQRIITILDTIQPKLAIVTKQNSQNNYSLFIFPFNLVIKISRICLWVCGQTCSCCHMDSKIFQFAFFKIFYNFLGIFEFHWIKSKRVHVFFHLSPWKDFNPLQTSPWKQGRDLSAGIRRTSSPAVRGR